MLQTNQDESFELECEDELEYQLEDIAGYLKEAEKVIYTLQRSQKDYYPNEMPKRTTRRYIELLEAPLKEIGFIMDELIEDYCF